MRKMIGAVLLAASLWLGAQPASARVAPITPEAQLMFQRQQALEEAVRQRFGFGSVERLRDMYGSVVVAEERNGRVASPRVLIKDENGWHELRGKGRGRVPPRVAHELNRLLVPEATWEEEAYFAGPCEGAARVFIVRHALKDRYGRQCRTFGRAGRAAEVAARLRVPAGGDLSLPMPTRRPPPPGMPAGEYAVNEHIYERLSEMAWAFERRALEGFVDPLAEQLILELPGRTLRGRSAAVEWARGLQDWSLRGGYNRVRLHQAEMSRLKDNVMIVRWELRFGEEGPGPIRRTYSATWRENRGIWEIAHLRVSGDKPIGPVPQRW